MEFTGQEQWVWECVGSGEISFLPIKKAMVVQGKTKEKQDLPGVPTAPPVLLPPVTSQHHATGFALMGPIRSGGWVVIGWWLWWWWWLWGDEVRWRRAEGGVMVGLMCRSVPQDERHGERPQRPQR